MTARNASEFVALTVTIDAAGLYDITAGGYIADSLTRDDALGCLASWIYQSRDTGALPQFMRPVVPAVPRPSTWMP